MKSDKMWTKTVILAAFSVALARSIKVSMDYSTVQATGKSCPGRDSCRQNRGTRGPMENDWKKRNCFCDNDCAKFGDCCIDAPAYDVVEQRDNPAKFDCFNLKQYGHVYMRAKCPKEWNLPNIKTACEAEPSQSDPLSRTPVTSSLTSVSYKNYYCAVCNRDSGGGIKFWQPRLECPTLTGYANRFRNISLQYIADRLVFDEDRNVWGVTFDAGGINVFHECVIDPTVPSDILGKIRQCHGRDMIADCAVDFAGDPSVKDLCRSYTGMVFDPNFAYRNIHCAMCNDADLENMICLNLGPLGRSSWQQNFNFNSFAVLLDFGSGFRDSVGLARKCNSGEVYDPFFKKCRNVVCAGKNEKFVNGECVGPDGANKPMTSESGELQAPSTSETPIRTSSVSSVYFPVEGLPITTTTSTTRAPPSPSSSSSTSTSTSTSTTTSPTTTSSSTTSPKTSSPTTHPSTSQPSSSSSPVTTSTSSSSSSSSTSSSSTSTSAPKSSTTTSMLSNSVYNRQVEVLACPKYKLEAGEYEMSANGSIMVPKYAKELSSVEYELDDITRSLFVCVDEVRPEDEVIAEARFGAEMGYITCFGLGVSIICLFLHVVAFFLAPELQNLSGKNLFSLVLALLGGYISFIASMFMGGNAGTTGCLVLAVVMYYCFVSAFSWMFLIAFDVARTLKLASTQLRLHSGAQWKKFGFYSLLAWGAPLVLVVTSLTLEFAGSESNQFKPGFGQSDFCWFANKRALLVFFALPLALFMVGNIVFFFISACIVYDTTKNSSKMTSCGPKTNFHLYLRLAVIMGLTWIVGLIAGFVNLEEVWYAFVALNTLQGLFIFVSFTCTKKVILSLTERFTGARPVTTGTSHTGSSGQWTSKSNSAGSRGRFKPRPGHHRPPPGNLTLSSTMSSSSSAERGLIGMKKPGKTSGQHPGEFTSVRGKTVYTVSDYQASHTLTQNSFDGRYF